MPRSTKPSLSFLFPHQNPVRISLQHAFHRPRIPILFYVCFCVTVYFQYRQHLKAIRYLFRWNRFLWIRLSTFKLITSLGLGVFLTSGTAMQFWQYDNFNSFLGVLEWPECGFIYQRTGFIWLRTWIIWQLFVGNGNELTTSVKAVKLLTSITTNTRSLQEKYALWFLYLRATELVIMPTQNYSHFVVHQCSKESKTLKWLHNFRYTPDACRKSEDQWPASHSKIHTQSQSIPCGICGRKGGNVTGFSMSI
jgi:hypothetical protein